MCFGIHIPEVHALVSGFAIDNACRFLNVTKISACGIRLAGGQVEIERRGAFSEVDGTVVTVGGIGGTFVTVGER